MLLSVENLHVYYGAIHAVKDVSLHVQEGEIVTLIGANGAGKSTVLNTISGLLKPRSGKIQFMDHNVTGVAPNKIVQTGLVQCPEGRRVFARMTVEENLEMGAYTRPNDKFDENQRAPYAGQRYALRRRAADAGHGKSAHERAEASHAR